MLSCENARLLIPSYLDGELSEEQAAPLRRHLLECSGCRLVAKEGRSLKRWFVRGAAPAVPVGFAARVARRAFAGDLGLEPIQTTASAAEAPILAFVLKITAVAAAALLALSVAIRMHTLPPSSEGLRADDMEVWDEIYDLDRPAPAGDEDEDAEEAADR